MTGPFGDGDGNSGILSWLYDSMYDGKQAASDAGDVAMKLLRSTGKAAWYAGTTFLVFILPLMILAEREQQQSDLDFQQAFMVGTRPLPPPPAQK